MDDSRPVGLGAVERPELADLGVAGQDPRHERPAAASGAGVDDEVPGLVHHDDVVVLEDDTELDAGVWFRRARPRLAGRDLERRADPEQRRTAGLGATVDPHPAVAMSSAAAALDIPVSSETARSNRTPASIAGTVVTTAPCSSGPEARSPLTWRPTRADAGMRGRPRGAHRP